MTMIDVNGMSLPELIWLQAEVANAITRAKQVQRKVVLQKLTDAASVHGFKLQELFGSFKKLNTRSGHASSNLSVLTSPAKYANPRKKSQTWTGRGRRPLWLKRAMKKPGAKLETFAVLRHA